MKQLPWPIGITRTSRNAPTEKYSLPLPEDNESWNNYPDRLELQELVE